MAVSHGIPTSDRFVKKSLIGKERKSVSKIIMPVMSRTELIKNIVDYSSI